MKIDIQALNVPLTSAEQGYIIRRLGFALSSHDEHIQRVSLRLSDINGPRGGNDQRCKVQVVLAHIPDIVIEDIEAEMSVAIDRAADRVGRTVARRLARHRDKGRSSGASKLLPLTELQELN